MAEKKTDTAEKANGNPDVTEAKADASADDASAPVQEGIGDITLVGGPADGEVRTISDIGPNGPVVLHTSAIVDNQTVDVRYDRDDKGVYRFHEPEDSDAA